MKRYHVQKTARKRGYMIFDTHAHYDDESFDEDREELIFSLKKRFPSSTFPKKKRSSPPPPTKIHFFPFSPSSPASTKERKA